MLTKEEISERNGLVVDFIKGLNLPILITNLADTPKFVNYVFTKQYCCYVKNFHLILLKGLDGDLYLDIRLKPLKNMDLDSLKPKVIEWMQCFTHNKIYALKLHNTSLYVCGFNHHDKALRINPYPVFAEFDPLTYYDLDAVKSVAAAFPNYHLTYE